MSRFSSGFVASPYRTEQGPKPVGQRRRIERDRRAPEVLCLQDVEDGLGPWSKDQGSPSSRAGEPPLPPQLGGSKWQQGQNSPRVPMDTATRYRMAMSGSRQQTGTAILVRPSSRRRRRLSLLSRRGTALGRLELSEEELKEQLEEDTVELVKELVSMPSKDRAKAIQGLPISLDERRNIRCRVLAAKFSKRSLEHTCCTDCWEQLSLTMRRCSSGMVSLRQSLSVWRSSLREIEGKFGSAVLSYFLFLRWLLLFNLLSSLLNVCFITLPQLLHGNNTAGASAGFNGLELLTGAGSFNQSVLYYGGYSSGGQPQYNIQLAYLCTITAYMLLCGVCLIYSMAGSFQRSFVLSGGPGSVSVSGGAWRLLCSWDFTLVSQRAVSMLRNNLLIQLKESLWERRQRVVLSVIEKTKYFFLRLCVWLLSAGLAIGSCIGVYFLCQNNLQWVKESHSSADTLTEGSSSPSSLLLPVVVCVINLCVPLVYTLTTRLENYASPRTHVYVSVLRNAMLKMSILGVLCYYWLSEVPSKVTCWESYVGQDVYRLVIVDFIFCLLGSFCGEYLWNVIGTSCVLDLGQPEFDIARNILDLINAQTLAWIGVYFSPLLPLIQVIKLFLIFQLKKRSVGQCQPPRRWARVGQMQTFFIALLFCPCCLGTLAVLAYTLWSVKPSAGCGPFQGLGSVLQAVSQWMDSPEAAVPSSAWAAWIIRNVIQSGLFYYLITLIVLVLMYFLWQITQGRKRLIMRLQEQIINEGKDMAFLLRKLQSLQKKKRGPIGPKTQVHFQEDRDRERQEAETSRTQRESEPEAEAESRPNSDRGSGQGREAPLPSHRPQPPPPPPPTRESPLSRTQEGSPRPGLGQGGRGQPPSPRGSPGRSRGIRQECWGEEEKPSSLWSLKSRGAIQGRPHRGPRLEPLPPRELPFLPGSVPESTPLWSQSRQVTSASRPGSSRPGVNQPQTPSE